jgi:Dna[CI] antecedent, DciA
MLQPLREMVKTWAPERIRATDPMSIITCIWESIVGNNVAQNTQPLRLDGGTLHVITTSSSWSQQLTFLEPHILHTLRQFPEIKHIERLRFRVSYLQHNVLPYTARVQTKPPILHAETDEDALADPLERFRRRCAQLLTRAHRLCASCGAALSGERTHCAPCTHTRRQEQDERVQRIMYEAPWLSCEEISAQVGGLTHTEYEEIRQKLLRRWWEILERAERTGELRPDGFERRITGSYLLLQSGLRPDCISQAAMRNLLGTRLEELLFGPTIPPSPPPYENTQVSKQ